ncbi:SpoIIE family protein phosphatase [Blastococcus sp. CCUG 61487]|uniref:SpoIIE family protein phosphatase n=1 Tax=Blastococcus sp. CCUG 61487 TaxID=1840703 RepID=UPI0010C06CEB|nr:SpoIIE family protein phosphatase [Blastococcus sp. CCUG 61487]TKJ30089.1 histidine kinase [Blastococcus sp. CCUG 61487]
MSALDPALGDRVAAVRRLEATAVGSRALQRLTALAVHMLGVDAAQVSLFSDVELVLGGTGLPPGTVGIQVPLTESLCAVTGAASPDPVVAPDARADSRLASLPPVVSGDVGSYLGIPLSVFEGQVVGALSAFGRGTRDWSDADVALLRQLGDSVETELQLAAQVRELESSRLAFELAIDFAGIGSFDWNLVTGRLAWDSRLQELFGFPPGDFGETIEAFTARCHPDDRDRVMDALQQAIDTVGDYEAEFRVVLPSGETRWIAARGRAVADDAGVTVRLLGAGYDTTAQRHADARVARVMESVKSAFFSLDRDWRFTYLNAEAERVLAASREDLLGQVVWEAFPDAAEAEFGTRYRAAVATGTEQLFEAYYPAPLDAWFEVRAWPNPDGLSVSFLDITQRRRAEERASRSTARLRLVAESTAAMSEGLTGDAAEEVALQRVSESLVPVLGDWVIASLVDADGRMSDVASWHRDPEQRARVARYAALRLAALPPHAPVLRALASGQLREVPDVLGTVGRSLPPGEARDLLTELAPQSAVTLPLTARGRTLGALSVYRSPERARADADDVEVLRDIADRVALALDNSRLFEQQRRLAEGLQRSMLTEPPEPDHAEIVVRYLPAVQVAEVGGDWYDAFIQPNGATVLVIGDVVGHDTAAAAAMGQLRGMLRGIGFREDAGPATILGDLDAAIEGLGMGTMATAAIARVEQTSEERARGLSRLRWSNAGHPPPLLLHADRRIEELATERAELMLGVDPSARRTESVVTVRRGTTLLLYTDGLVEGRDLPLDVGIARLREALAELADRPLGELCDEVIARLRPEGLQDDVALVAIRLHPEDRPRPAEAGPERLPPVAGS